MRRKTLLLLLAGSVFLLVFVSVAAWIITPKYARSVEAHIEVANYVGINVDNDKLYFGANSPGGGGKRDIFITSDEKVFVTITEEGEMASWLWPSENRFIVAANEEKRVTMYLSIPKETIHGNYTGTVITKYYRPIARLILG